MSVASVSEPIPVRDGRYVVRGHVVEVKDGKQMPYAGPQPTEIAPQQQAGVETWRNTMPVNYDFQNKYNGFSNGHSNSGILYAKNVFRNEGTLYSTQAAYDPYGPPVVPVSYGGFESYGNTGERTDNGPVTDTLTMAEQEKLRADAIAKSGPKLAFINEESQKYPPEGALPCVMGRDSPGGSVTSLDSLDEPQGKGPELGVSSSSGIMAKGGKEVTKSAGKRRVTFSDSIEFDDGVTGQLVTDEKQSTKMYTMLYARNANNYYVPSTSPAATSGQSVASQKGNKSSGLTSGAQIGTEANSTSVKTFGREPSVVTVTHCDQPKPKPVALNNNHPTKPEKVQSFSRQENLSEEFSLTQQNHGKDTEGPKDEPVVSDQELNDSLEVIRDSLDEKDDQTDVAQVKQQVDEEYKKSSAVTWTIGPSELKDSFERYVQSTAESTAEELIDAAPSSESENHPSERDRGFVSHPLEESGRGSASNALGERESIDTKTGYMANPSPVTSGYAYYQPLNTSGASAAVPSPHLYHHNANVYSGLHSSAQGTFHQHFPYPFYTSAGTTLMGMSPSRQHQLERSSGPFATQLTATNYRVEGREVVQSIEPQRTVVQEGVLSPSTVRTVKIDATESTGLQEGGRPHDEAKSEMSRVVTTRQKHSSSPTSTASSASLGTRSTRSLIPRPPATKRTGRGRLHPATLYKKQTTARPRKAIHNHPVSSNNGQPVKNDKVGSNNKGNNQTERGVIRQNSASPRSENGKNRRTHSKRPNGAKHDNSDHDDIIEGIKRNMEVMNMRARHTAAEEQHQRIINSLRLEFGDDKWEKSSQQVSPVVGGNQREYDHGEIQEVASRRLHHPWVESAGSRAGRPPAVGAVRTDAANDDNYQLTGSRAVSFQPAGSQGGRPPPGNSAKMDPASDGIYQPPGPHPAGPWSVRPPVGLNRLDPSGGGSYQSAASQATITPTGGSIRMGFVSDNKDQPGFDRYLTKGRAGNGIKGIVQKPPYAPAINQQIFYEDRRHEYPTSTVGYPTSAATTRQEREEPQQARGATVYEREDSDLKQSISLDKTPTDDEINHLWEHVRSYLHSGNTKSVGSDSCVNRVDVRRSRTRSSSTQQAFSQRTAPQQSPQGGQFINGQHLLEVPPQSGGSTLGGLRRYGSHEVLRRDSSSDSLSLKRSPLLQHRASRSRRPPKHAQGQNGRPPLPRQHDFNPSPSQAGPSASMATRGNLGFFISRVWAVSQQSCLLSEMK